ncbi:MAG: DUF924 domain-containing protein [Aphanocapsa lilacina HA4352-LM1]|nr:DUF924 domain-containing protein [Aphanocapsa lilacina HA4352-LM1]
MDVGKRNIRGCASLLVSRRRRPADHQRVAELAKALTEAEPRADRELLEFSADQARSHRDVIARFGCHPHRNAVLGRESTPAEREYLAIGRFVHTRSFEDWQNTRTVSEYQ